MHHNNKLMIGKPAPHFSAKAYLKGEFVDIQLEDYKGKYVVLFFYPLDFTFVCPTEILSFDDHNAEFKANNAVLLGCSVEQLQEAVQVVGGDLERVRRHLKGR